METRASAAVRNRPGRQTSTQGPETQRIGVFTAIDGTLLDARTFKAGASRAMIRQLHAAEVAVVPLSVMTLEEIAPIAAELGLREAMVIEDGGAIARWRDGQWDVEPCGPQAETFLDGITEIEDRSGANLLVYSAMEESHAAQVSGHSGAMLQATRHRCYSEPFAIESGDFESIAKAAAEIGFSVRRGKRFLHLCRACDEGEAFTRLREELQCDVAIGVGSSVVDAEFLTRSDIAIVVPGPDGTADSELLAMLPEARVAHTAGPDGWAAAVDEVVRNLAAPKRRARRAAS